MQDCVKKLLSTHTAALCAKWKKGLKSCFADQRKVRKCLGGAVWSVGAGSAHPGSVSAPAWVEAEAGMALAGLKELPSWEGAGISESPAAEELLCHFLLSSPLQTPLSWGGELCAWGRMFCLAPALCSPFSWRATWRCLCRDFPKGSVDGGWRRNKPTGRTRRPLPGSVCLQAFLLLRGWRMR